MAAIEMIPIAIAPKLSFEAYSVSDIESMEYKRDNYAFLVPMNCFFQYAFS